MAAPTAPALGEDEPLAAINIIPFVDIVLVLLIIFMVTSTAILKASFEVSLPRAASGGAAVASTLNLVLTAEGQLLLDGRPLRREELGAAVARAARGAPGLQAVIAADRRAPYGQVIALIDAVKQGGVKAFALDLERQQPAPGRP